MQNQLEIDLSQVRHAHFVGIGGAGMGAIAEIMLHQGYQVSGSDLQRTDFIAHLSRLGAHISQGHHASHLTEPDVVVYSSAIEADNPELVAAHQRAIPVLQRAQMLAAVMQQYQGIAIAGTHGKTTTTSLVASVLDEAGLDPTFIIGGSLNSIGTHAQLGQGPYLVAEADESDASFLNLRPQFAVVTNIEPDHLNNFSDSFQNLKASFATFLQQLPESGLAILSMDDENVTALRGSLRCSVQTYGFSEGADWHISEFEQNGVVTHMTVNHNGQSHVYQLSLPGRHNASNALAAIVIASHLGADQKAIARALKSFAGVERRFQVYGEQPVAGVHSVWLLDDYGHHPSEIRAMLQTTRSAWPDKRLVVAFQPHRYSRTQAMMAEFAETLSAADEVLLLEVYSAGEAAIAGADSAQLCTLLKASMGARAQFVGPYDFARLSSALAAVLKPDDVLLTLGAGDIGEFAPQAAKLAGSAS